MFVKKNLTSERENYYILQRVVISDIAKMILGVINTRNRESCMGGKDGKGKSKLKVH